MTLEDAHRSAHYLRVRESLETAAWRLFVRQGYDDTTVDEIAAAAGVAPRTFFRYFETKEAVLFGNWREHLVEFTDHLRARPPSEDPLTALAACVRDLSEQFEDDAAELLLRARIKAGATRLGGYRYEVVQPASVEAIAQVLGDRLEVDMDLDPRPRLFASVVTVALDTARDVWIARGGRQPIAQIVEEVLAELGRPD